MQLAESHESTAAVPAVEFLAYCGSVTTTYRQKGHWKTFFGHLIFLVFLLAFMDYSRTIALEYDLENAYRCVRINSIELSRDCGLCSDALVEEEFNSIDASNLQKTFHDIGEASAAVTQLLIAGCRVCRGILAMGAVVAASCRSHCCQVRGPLLGAYYGDTLFSLDDLPTAGTSSTVSAPQGLELNC